MADNAKCSVKVKTKKKSTRSTNDNSTPTKCTICEDPVKDANEKEAGEDSIFCEGTCKSWLHRRCAGLSKTNFDAIRSLPSSSPYYCPHCRIMSLTNELTEVKSQLSKLASEFSNIRATQQPPSAVITSDPSPSTTANAPSMAKVVLNKTQFLSSNLNEDRKFNLVIYGIAESPKGTNRHERVANDISNSMTILKTVNSGISENPIRDCIRLGSYSESKSRPLLVKFVRVIDVSTTLANRRKLATLEGVSIKPHLSPLQRKVEGVLLKKRRSLIDSGVTPNRIRIDISNASLYLDSQLHGEALNGSFVCTTNSTDTSISDSDEEEPPSVVQSPVPASTSPAPSSSNPSSSNHSTFSRPNQSTTNPTSNTHRSHQATTTIPAPNQPKQPKN